MANRLADTLQASAAEAATDLVAVVLNVGLEVDLWGGKHRLLLDLSRFDATSMCL
jgi:hypothetical protein